MTVRWLQLCALCTLSIIVA